MYLPIHDSTPAAYVTATSFFAGDSKLREGGWSSLIGVVTAIVGNILISFALNTQRYAHMRLSRDKEAKVQEKKQAARTTAPRDADYGTQQRAVAESRARQNAKAEPNGYTLEQAEDVDEGDPLIPKMTSTNTLDDSRDTLNTVDAKDLKEKSYLKSPIWWLGISMMVVGEAGNFLAYGFAPASIVSPLGVVALISNCIIAPLLLGEKFRWRDAIGVIIAIAGCVVVVLSASDSNPKLTPDAIWGLVTTWEFETYLGITIFLILVLMVVSNKFGDKSILIDLGLVALFGGYTALSTKGVASLLTYKIWKVVTFPITYLLLAVLVLTAVMQIKYVNRALQRFNATMVIPTQFVLFTISVIVGSAVLYRDFEREQTGDAIKFVAGCALTFFGVWCITSGRNNDTDDTASTAVEEDGISLYDEERTMPEIREHDPTNTAGFSSSAGETPTTDSSSARTVRPIHRPSEAEVALSIPEDAQVEHLADQLANMPPGNASAVHTESSAPIVSMHSYAEPQKKPTIHATTSEPLIPQTPNPKAALRPQTPLNRAPSSPFAGESPSRTSPTRREQAQTRLEASGSRRLISRNSVGGLLPGPFTSPLSGSLSAIVADEIRRGVDRLPSVGHLARRRKTPIASQAKRPLEQQLFGNQLSASDARKRHSITSGTEADFDTDEAAQLRDATGSPRMRSLSANVDNMIASSTRDNLRKNKQRAPGEQEARREASLRQVFRDSSTEEQS